MRRLNLLFWLFLSQLSFAQLYQQARFYQWGVNAPIGPINSFALSNDGYLWLAGNDGLHRFDGHRYISFKTNPYDTSSLPTDAIARVFYDSFSHHLWLVFQGAGFAVFDCNTHLVIKKGKLNSIQKSKEDGIKSILFLADKVIMTTCYSGIFEVDKRQAEMSAKKLALKGEIGEPYQAACCSRIIRDIKNPNLLWCLSPNGIESINLKSRVATFFLPRFSSNETKLLPTGLFDLAQTNNGTLWLASYSNGLYAWHPDSAYWQRFSLPGISTDSMQLTFKLVALNNLLYVSQDNRKLWSFNPKYKKFKLLGSGDYQSPNPVQCTMMLAGSDQEIWTIDELGLGCFYPKWPRLKEYIPSYQNRKLTVWGFNHDQNHYYLGAYNLEGIIQISKHSDSVKMIGFNSSDFKLLNAKDIQWINGRLLLNQASNRLFYFDPQKQQFESVNTEWNGKTPVYAVRAHQNNKILSCHRFENEIYHVLSDLKTGKEINRYQTGNFCLIGIKGDWFYLVDSNNRPVRISAKTGEYQKVEFSQKLNELIKSPLSFLGSDAQGKVWYHLDKVGLMAFSSEDTFQLIQWLQDLEETPFYNLKRVGGIQSNLFYFFQHHQIYQFNPISKEVRSVNLSTLLMPGEHIRSIIRTDTDVMVNTNLRVILTSLNEWFINNEPGAVRLSALSVDGQSIPMTNHFNFPPYVKQISFFFSRSKLILQDFIEFRYRRKNDKKWLPMKNPELKFEYPSPGTYHFEVQARVNGSQWPNQTYNLIYKVQPYWYQAKWFNGILISSAFLLSFWIYRKRLKTKVESEQNRLKQELEKSALKISLFKSQMNPHFLFNALNGVNYLIISDKTDLASQYLKRFSKLMRMVLNWSAQEWISLSEEIEFVNHYMNLEMLRFQGKLTFDVIIDMRHSPEEVNFPAMLLQPLLENAIWHGIMPKPEGGLITLSVQEVNRSLHLKVQDNGVGRSSKPKAADEKGKSFGLELLYQRINLLNQQKNVNLEFYLEDLFDLNQNPCGTIAHLIIKNVDL